MESSFDIATLVQATQLSFRVDRNVPILEDHSNVTWTNLTVLLQELTAVTTSVQRRAAIFAEKSDEEDPGLFGEPWDPSDRIRWNDEMLAWGNRLLEYDALVLQHQNNDSQEESAWELVGRRLLTGNYTYTDSEGVVIEHDGLPDFVIPFTLANQLSVARDFYTSLRDEWAYYLKYGITVTGETGELIAEESSELVKEAVATTKSAIRSARSGLPIVAFIGGAVMVLLATRK